MSPPFATYWYVWIYRRRLQQTRVLIYSASGGLFGLGLGKGKLREVFAASTDLVFGMLCEEWGLLLGVFILIVFLLLAVFAVKTARVSGSAFYAIACVAAAAMMLFQTALNVFGVTDLLPWQVSVAVYQPGRLDYDLLVGSSGLYEMRPLCRQRSQLYIERRATDGRPCKTVEERGDLY